MHVCVCMCVYVSVYAYVQMDFGLKATHYYKIDYDTLIAYSIRLC